MMTIHKWHKNPNPTYEDGFAHGYEAHRAEQALERPNTHVEWLKPMGLATSPKQEPVAWVKDNLICPENGYETTITEQHPKDLEFTPLYINQQELEQEPIAVCKDSIVNWVNGRAIDGWLYTHPAPLWQGLSDDEIDAVWFEVVKENNFEGAGKYFVRAIEQALKEKNNAV